MRSLFSVFLVVLSFSFCCCAVDYRNWKVVDFKIENVEQLNAVKRLEMMSGVSICQINLFKDLDTLKKCEKVYENTRRQAGSLI